MPPEIRYTRSGTVNIAYQVYGDGPVDLALVPGWISNLDIIWEEPRMRRFLEGFGRFARVMIFDKRGTGLSDRVTDTPALEERMEDLTAVMNAAGSEQAFIVGWSEAGPMCALYAATYPERVRGLVMDGAFPKRTKSYDFPHGVDRAKIEDFLDRIESEWGGPFALDERAPSACRDPALRAWWARYLRCSMSPAAATLLTRANMQIDVRDVLPVISVPTLVIHARGDRAVPIAAGRYMAERIPGARLVEIDSDDHLPWLDKSARHVAAIRNFVATGAAAAPSARSLCAILFTDIVGSTERATALGDRAWRDLMDRHDAITRDALSCHGGREVNTTGDGFVAVFDGPARAARCAADLGRALREIGVDIRAGVHVGECEVRAGVHSGLAIHIAARVCDQAGPGEILVSQTVKDLVAGSGLGFEPAGERTLKGVAEPMRLHRVALAPAAPRRLRMSG